MLRNIVAGYDGTRSSQVAVEQAIDLAEEMGGRVYLATVTASGGDDAEAEDAGEEDIADLAMPARFRSEEDEEREQVTDEMPLSLEEIHRRCQDLHIACEDERLFGRHAGARLLRRSWHAELLVLGRGDERRPGVIGPNATYLLSELVTPTLICARQLIEPRSLLIPYRSSVSGGRGLSFAARLCEHLNADLHVLVCEPRRTTAREAVEQAEKLLRGYRIDIETDVSLTPPHEAVHSAAIDRDVPLVVIPGAHKRYYLFPWQRNETLWRALEVPGAAVLAIP